jgi:hypothetical protein
MPREPCVAECGLPVGARKQPVRGTSAIVESADSDYPG